MDFGQLVKFAELYSEAAISDRKKEYMREYMKKRYHSKMNAVREQLGNKCNSCGVKDVPFHLDHIDSSKKTMRAADIHSTSDGKVKEEVKNLQLLCGPCHKKKTKDEWDFSTPKSRHGTYHMYRKHKCRCDECTKAYKETTKAWREKAKEKKNKEKAP